MQTIKARLHEELPLIESALNQALDTLPSSVRPIAEHIFSAGGKRLRPFLTVLMARLLGYKDNDIYNLAISMEMLHAATLLHDDVLDDSITRRGKASAHTVFDVRSTILAGDALLAAANALVASFDNTRLCHCFAEATTRTANGEILEIQYLNSLDQEPSIYEEIILGKTAWLLRATCVLGALRAGASEQVLEQVAIYGQELGMAFQMVDDALDFAPEAITGKPTGGDIREGKLTPPVRMYRESLNPDEQAKFDQAFTEGTFTKDDAKNMGEEICRLGFDAKTRAMASDSINKALQALDTLPRRPEWDILKEMTDYVIKREK